LPAAIAVRPKQGPPGGCGVVAELANGKSRPLRSLLIPRRTTFEDGDRFAAHPDLDPHFAAELGVRRRGHQPAQQSTVARWAPYLTLNCSRSGGIARRRHRRGLPASAGRSLAIFIAYMYYTGSYGERRSDPRSEAPSRPHADRAGREDRPATVGRSPLGARCCCPQLRDSSARHSRMRPRALIPPLQTG